MAKPNVVRRTFKVVENSPVGWVIIWPNNRVTKARSAFAAKRAITRSARRIGLTGRLVVDRVEWDCSTKVGQQAVEVLA